MKKIFFNIVLALLLTGCSSYKPSVSNGNYREPVSYDGKRSMGIFLFASGNEPFWVVDLNSNDSTRIFILAENYTVKSKTPVPVLDSVTKTIKYTFDSGAVLILKKSKCVDNMSGEINEFEASLKLSGKNYYGCAKFIIASMNPFLDQSTLRLNDIWALRKFRGKQIVTSEFKNGVPVIELHLNDGRFMGNAECNTISGSLDVGDSYITFSDFTSTKKLCDGDFEWQYIDVLKSVDSWTLDKMLLILKKDGREVLVFHKVD
jgi:heat shock protein HslJ/uncharacterized membrane protein